jgi:hypothetical protein
METVIESMLQQMKEKGLGDHLTAARRLLDYQSEK